MKKRIKIIIWGINLILFASVCYIGIDLAGKGAEVARLNDQLTSLTISKQEISEKILGETSIMSGSKKATELGFNKPTNIIYLDSQEIIARLPVR